MKETLVQYKKPIAALVFIGLAILAYVFRNEWLAWFKPNPVVSTKNSENQNTQPPTSNSNSSTNSTSSTFINKDLTLSKGSHNNEVRALQRLMNEHHKYMTDQGILAPPMPILEVDGVFGTKTEEMLNFMTGKNTSSINQFTNFINGQKATNTSIYTYTW